MSVPGSRSSRLPVIRRCMISAAPSSRRTIRYFPLLPTASIRRPASASSVAAGGSGRVQRSSSTSALSIVRPTSSGSSWRRTVSTSGSSGTPPLKRVALHPAGQARGWAEHSRRETPWRRVRSRLTYANVTATLALAIAVAGGTAYAANTVFSSDIVDNQVRSVDVRDEGLRGVDIANASSGSDNVNADKLDGLDSSGLVQGRGKVLAGRFILAEDAPDRTLFQIPGFRSALRQLWVRRREKDGDCGRVRRSGRSEPDVHLSGSGDALDGGRMRRGAGQVRAPAGR